ncbi:MAG TPA: MFS transporter [Pseudonocardiaceae bacterium]|nr:MFS transporter [Pseudonocardiaceae bacterium]
MLCITEIVSWGVLYYAFSVLSPGITRDTGWSSTWVTAAFSVGQVTAAGVGIPVGRWLDTWGPRRVMTAGSALAVPAVLGIAAAPSIPWFFAAWVLAGVAMAAVLYQPAFAALTRWWGRRRVIALTVVTLAGGLASTVFAPLTATLAQHFDWRHTYVVLACVLAAVTLPAHLFGLAGHWPAGEAAHHERPAAPGSVVRSRAFVLLAVAMSLAAFAAYAVVVNLVPLLTSRGLSTSTAALALGLGGIGQVSGRMGYGRLAALTSTRARTVLVFGASAVAIALLAVVPGPTVLVIAIAMVAGATRGIYTLVQATAVSDRWGAAHFGRLNGVLTAPVTLAMSLAPWAGTVLAVWLGGYPHMFLLLAGIGLVAAVIAATTV